MRIRFAYPGTSFEKGQAARESMRGAMGVTREIEFLQDAQVTIVSDRRESRPFGLAGGGAGQSGRNVLIRKGREKKLPGKTTLAVNKGDRLRIETPGGGGYGAVRGKKAR